jgi:SAM-dependent methyltransferase
MSSPIRTIEVRHCVLCGEEGRLLYGGLRDRLFSVAGTWSIAQCPAPSCGLLWLNPMPVPEDIHRVYETYYTHVEGRRRGGMLDRFFAAAKRGYVANHFGYGTGASFRDRVLGLLPWLYPGRPAELDFSVMWLKAQPAHHAGTVGLAPVRPVRQAMGRLLDVGAGNGWLVGHMTSLGWQAEGLDFDARAVDLARTRGMTVHRGGLLDQGFAQGSFDAVTMSHSIEHVHDPVNWLAEARRILRPGGRLAIATPNASSFLHRRFRQHWFSLEPPRHLYLFNRAALASALRKSGFKSFRLFTSARDASGVFLGSRAIRKSGRHDMASRQPSVARILARGVQVTEIMHLMVDRDAGEDLVALAQT